MPASSSRLPREQGLLEAGVTTQEGAPGRSPPGNAVLVRARKRALRSASPCRDVRAHDPLQPALRPLLPGTRRYRREGEMPGSAIRSLVDQAVEAGMPRRGPDRRESRSSARTSARSTGTFASGARWSRCSRTARSSTTRRSRCSAELPPNRVEVSVYGATRETYESVTGVPGSHDDAWRASDHMLDRGVRVALKTVILRRNQHEVEAMAALAELARRTVPERPGLVPAPGR